MSFFGLFKKEAKASNVFAFGTDCVRFVSLGATDEGVQVDLHAEISAEGFVDEFGQIIDDAKFVERMRGFGLEHKISFANVVVPDSSAIVFHTHIAKQLPREMGDVIVDHLKTYCEAHGLLGFDDYVCEYDVIHVGESGYDTHVTLVPKSEVAHIARLFKQAGIQIVHLETAHHAVARACFGFQVGSGYAAVSVGRTKTAVSIVHGEHLVSHDIIPVGSESFHVAIEKRLRIGREESSRIIARHGILATHPDAGVLADVRNVADEIARSIDRQIVMIGKRTYKTFGERFSVDGIIVYGSGSGIKGLAEYLSESVRLPAAVLDVWQASGARHVPIVNLPASDVPAYAEALSMALIYLGK